LIGADSLPSEQWFDAGYWESQRKVVARSGAGRGAVIFVRDANISWALRHYRRGGLIGKVNADRYFWTGEESSRAFSEWRLLYRLRELNLPVPTPVAARYVRSGWLYRADLLTETLPAVRTLADTITGARLTDEIWRKIGATIARFHVHGVAHADLNAHNILLGESASIWILDFDRGRIRPRGSWEQLVLGRLQRSLLKIQSQRTSVQFDDRDWQALMVGYKEVDSRS
jgi:3-deoxy-D-manno-octulosonic acid kinase